MQINFPERAEGQSQYFVRIIGGYVDPELHTKLLHRSVEGLYLGIGATKLEFSENFIVQIIFNSIYYRAEYCIDINPISQFDGYSFLNFSAGKQFPELEDKLRIKDFKDIFMYILGTKVSFLDMTCTLLYMGREINTIFTRDL